MMLNHNYKLFFVTLVASLLSFYATADTTGMTQLYADTFEAGMGNWSNVSGSDTDDWIRNSGSTTSGSTGPNSGANGSSFYLYMETSSGFAYSNGETATLVSPALSVGSRFYLTFDYHMYGIDTGALAVDALVNGSWVTNIWVISGQQHSNGSAPYNHQEVDLSAYNLEKIRLRATAAGNYMGDIALDNVQIWTIPSGPQSPSFNAASLTKTTARAGQNYNDSIASDASDNNGDTLSFSKISGPNWLNVDVSGQLSGTPSSGDVGMNYVTVAASDGQFTATADVMIEVLDANALRLISSSTFESGMDDWKNITASDSHDWTRYSGATPSSGTGPNTGSNSNWYLYLETSSGSAYSLGNNAILEGPVFSPANITLDFDYHFYGGTIGTLSVDVLSQGNWINNVWSINGQQQTSNAALYGHATVTLNNYAATQVRLRATAAGGYTGDMAIDNIDIRIAPSNPVAPQFTSNPISKPNAKQDVAYSASLASDTSDGNGDVISFTKLSGPNWLIVESDGTLSGTPGASDIGANQFVIEASDGSLSTSATLDIIVENNIAPTVINYTDFESGWGDWYNVTDDNQQWLRNSNGTPSSNTGPATGAMGTTFYAYFETSTGYANSSGNNAILASPIFSGSDIRFSFAYHMYGIETGSLALDIFSNDAWIQNVWHQSGQQHSNSSSAYALADVDLSNYPNVTQLRLRATAVGGYYGDIAIDELTISGTVNDSDGDGVLNAADLCPNTPALAAVDTNGCALAQLDSDSDGINDANDAFPNDPSESIDTDGDGIGDNADSDDDNDGVIDTNDAFPLSANETQDFDGDGLGNNADSDDDNDGVGDVLDAFPFDTTEWLDTDGDGIGNNADTDDDNDGVPDTSDAFPLNASETQDFDGDGVGNNSDNDDDNDGFADALDAFPFKAAEWLDTDGDGIGNNADSDDDNDGVPDSQDALPLNANETQDFDGDGIGNNADSDDDNDGFADALDAFSFNAAEWLDTDGDGIGNNADADDDNDGIIDNQDGFPLIALGGMLDSDNDGRPDDCNVACLATGMYADSDDDNDGVSDAEELLNGTNPLIADSDDDGWSDGDELACHSEGNNSSVTPLDSDNDDVCDALDPDADGNGLIEITTLDDLNSIRDFLDGSGLHGSNAGCDICIGFELLNDLDFDENQDGLVDANDYDGRFWNNGQGWQPLSEFTAVFEGNNHTIHNLTITADGQLPLGLFGYVSYSDIRNLNLSGKITSYANNHSVGLLASYVRYDTLISNVHVSGSIHSSAEWVGGAIGSVYGNLTLHNLTSDVEIEGGKFTGGLVGSISGNSSQFPAVLDRSHASGNINGEFVIGGLVGQSRHLNIYKSYYVGNIFNTSTASRADTGGLVGRFDMTAGYGYIKNSFATSIITSNGSNVGGLVGYSKGVSLTDTYFSGAVNGDNRIAGLVGYSESASIRSSYASATVTGNSNVGPIVGGPSYSYNINFNDVFWNSDTYNGAVYGYRYMPLTDIQLRCPTSNIHVCNGETDNPFALLDDTLWHFGDSSQLPALIIDGMIYRDIDGDGKLDLTAP